MPSYYVQNLYWRLQMLRQGSMTVDEYYKKMEMLMIQAELRKDGEALLARFIAGLKFEIREIMELQYYLEIGKLVEKLSR